MALNSNDGKIKMLLYSIICSSDNFEIILYKFVQFVQIYIKFHVYTCLYIYLYI